MSDEQNKNDPSKMAAAEAINTATKKGMVFALSQDAGEALEKAGYEPTNPASPLMFALQQASGTAKKAPQLAFTENPTPSDNYLGLYKSKRRLLPDEALKQIRITDHLIAAILRARGAMMSLFGHLRKDRFDVGFETCIKQEFEDLLSPEQFEKVVERMKRFEKILLNCGHTAGLEYQDRMTLAQWMDIQAQNGLTFGRFATEVIRDLDAEKDSEGNYPFHRFRPRDVGTIVRAVRKGENVGNGLRLSAMKLLENLTGDKPNIDLNKLKEDEYAWLQVIDGTPRQAFTHDEMLVFNLFNSTDIEHNGYPVSPLDTVVSSVTTHISIDAYKKLYFQNGRASKGMLVIKSDEVDEQILNGIKLQFNASINNVSNSFRTPIFGMGREDDIEWLPFNGEGIQDSDFQFMYDQIARNILSAFSISPDELPGYSHLSRGTNSQTLSECFDLGTRLLTPEGMTTVEGLLGTNSEVFTQLWTGLKWENAKVFLTGNKSLMETVLDSNLSIKTSPDHRFYVVGESGEPEWIHQSDLKIGDTVLTNKQDVHSNSALPSFKGQTITPELMEVLGWMTGDGSLISSKKRAGGVMHLYYHHSKERGIWASHFNILASFGINVQQKEIHLSDEECEKIKARYGFDTTSSVRIKTIAYDTDFTNWLESIGFNSSIKGKCVPSFIFTLPSDLKNAYLRGLFSADGGINKATGGSVILTITPDLLRSQVRELLNTVGIRTQRTQGTTKECFQGSERITVKADTKLFIKDKRRFFSEIGFLQAHKQPQALWLVGSDPVSIPRSTQAKYVTALLKSDLARKYKKDLYAFVSEDLSKKLTLSRLKSLMVEAGLSIPSWMNDYSLDKVKKLVDHGCSVPMADATLFNEDHAFVANGIVVHNSSNEFKLTAARDTGLRPLILKFQTFFNEILFPLIDPLLAKICEIKFTGIDAQSKEQESTRLQQDMAIHMTMDDLLREVDKDPIGKAMGGQFPFNERWQLVADKYLNIGDLKAEFFGDPTGYTDPMLKYKRDPFFLQYLQLLVQSNPAAVKAYFAPKPYAMEFLKMAVQDSLDEDEE